MVVARIGVTLTELARDRDALVATLRAAAPGAPVSAPPAPHRPRRRTGPATGPAAPAPAAPSSGRPRRPPSPGPPVPAATGPPRPRRRLSPQQVLLGLGALLLVAASIAFVAVAWTRLGVVFQSAVMLVVTALLCGASAWTARTRPACHRGGAGRGGRGAAGRRPRRGAGPRAVPARGRAAPLVVGDLLRRRRGGHRRAGPADPVDGDLAAGRPAGRPAAAVPGAPPGPAHRSGRGRGGAARRGGRRRGRPVAAPLPGAGRLGAGRPGGGGRGVRRADRGGRGPGRRFVGDDGAADPGGCGRGRAHPVAPTPRAAARTRDDDRCRRPSSPAWRWRGRST